MKIKIFFLLSVIVMSFILSNIVVGRDFLNKASNLCGELNVKLDTATSSDKEDVIFSGSRGGRLLPEFTGEETVAEWVHSRLCYPVLAKENGIEGKVYVRFTIEDDGSVTNVKVIRGVCAILDNETIRVVESMPKWKPSELHGKAVRCTFQMPVRFKLDSASRNKVFDQRIVDSILEYGKVYSIVDKMPKFPHGDVVEWIHSKISFDKGISHLYANIIVEFIVDKDGTVSNIEITKSSNQVASEEIMRLMKSMPKWSAGSNKGKTVPVSMRLQIVLYE